MYIFTSIANSEHDVTSTIDNSETSQDCTHFLESRKICSHLDLCFNVSYFNSRLLLFILSFGGYFVHLLIVDSRAMTGTEGRKREMGNDMHQKLDVNQPLFWSLFYIDIISWRAGIETVISRYLLHCTSPTRFFL